MAPTPQRLTVQRVGSVRTTSNGNSYLECQTQAGQIAVWGSGMNRRNIDLVQQQPVTFEAVMSCIGGRWAQHTYWVPEGTTIELVPVQQVEKVHQPWEVEDENLPF